MTENGADVALSATSAPFFGIQEAFSGWSGVDGGMNGGSLSLGRYAGIPVRAHWSIALIVLLFGTILAGRLGLTGGIVATARLLRLDPRPRVRPRARRAPVRRPDGIDRPVAPRRRRVARPGTTDAARRRADRRRRARRQPADRRGRDRGRIRLRIGRARLGRVRERPARRVQHAPGRATRRWTGAAGVALGSHRQQVPGARAMPARPDGCSDGPWPASASP